METPGCNTDFKCEPFWWEGAQSPADNYPELPSEADVVVVGSGYTGLHAALQTARSGLSTLVLDAASLGHGCSSRNGGQVATGIKGSYSELAARHGKQRAVNLLQEGARALEFLDAFIRDEKIDCDWVRCGHFSGAHNQAAYDRTAHALESLPPEVDMEWRLVPRSEQHSEIGTDLYHGGVVFPRHGALHPGRYHVELLNRVKQSGATAIGDCAVERIDQDTSGFVLHTSQGVVRAGKVAIATNGYTGPVTPWLRRRIIPIGSYIIATEPLDEELARAISPHNRTMTDTRKLVFYYRLCPQGRRMLFGGRVALTETDPRASAPALHAAMTEIFPRLESARITHSWLGFVGYTFDTLPHVGEQAGMHYAMGYCGSGISLASYCGSMIGARMCGDDGHKSELLQLRFKTRPFYTGNPWFLQPSIMYYRMRDRLNC